MSRLDELVVAPNSCIREVLECIDRGAQGIAGEWGHNTLPWMRPEDHAHLLEGLRKAGWRET